MCVICNSTAEISGQFSNCVLFIIVVDVGVNLCRHLDVCMPHEAARFQQGNALPRQYRTKGVPQGVYRASFLPPCTERTPNECQAGHDNLFSDAAIHIDSTIITSESGNRLELRYYVCASSGAYGIRVEERPADRADVMIFAETYGLTRARNEAEALAHRLAAGTVTPTSLYDVVDDLMGGGSDG